MNLSATEEHVPAPDNPQPPLSAGIDALGLAAAGSVEPGALGSVDPQGGNGVTRQRDVLDLVQIAADLENHSPLEVVAWALERFGDRAAVVTALQVDGMAILDMAYRIDPRVRIVTVDTGRLPAETYAFMEQVRQRYPRARWDVRFPDYEEVEAMVRTSGPNLFRQDVSLRLTCCQIRKVHHLLRALADLDAWFTGLRRDQTASRANVKKVEMDLDHDGIVKVNPLADWTKEEVWEYVRTHQVPYHPLYDKGYASIGCEPCTRAVRPGENDRAGRWWWEVNAPKECGIHYKIETGLGGDAVVKSVRVRPPLNADSPLIQPLEEPDSEP